MKPSLSLLPLTAALLLANEFVVSSFASSPPPIPMNQLGAVAGKQYQGDGLSVRATATGAELRCAFQRLEGEVTADGLWLRSTADNSSGERFRVLATGVGRDRECAAGSCCGSADWQSAVSRIGNPQAAPGWSVQPTASRRHSRLPTCATAERPVPMPAMGRVETSENVTRFIRPGLTEEYSVSVDGVRQDFLIAQPPVGTGELRLELEITGATVKPLGTGVRLTLLGSARQLAYHRLHVTDATGRELPARMEVASGILPDVEGAHPAARNSRATSLTGYPEATPESAGLEAPALRQARMPAATRLAVLVDDANAVYPVRIDPTFSDANWVSLSDLPGANGGVYALVTDEFGNLYIGGAFTAVREVVANGIAKWNGSEWSALETPGLFPLTTGFMPGSVVRTLVVAGTNLYAGGNFWAPNFYTQKVAKWDGVAWSALGSGLGGSGSDTSVYALATDGTNVYVGGEFTTAGGVTVNRIAKWNGTAWSALGSGVSGLVQALVVSATNLYAGGQFTSAGGNAANYIAKWNGTQWSPLGLGMDNWVQSLAVSGTNLFAGGSFRTAGGVPANKIAKWNGSAWSSIGSSIRSEAVYALAVSGDDLYASGWFTSSGYPANSIAKWNGTNWSVLGSAMNDRVYALTVSGTNVYAGGWFTKAGVTAANSIAKWNGTAWSGWGGGLNGDVYALAISDTNLYIGGNFTTVVGTTAARIAKWNGSVWSALGYGMSGPVRALAVSGTNLYAGGNFATADFTTVNHIAKWNGITWSDLASGMGGGNLYNPTVYALAILGTNLYAGGFFVTANGIDNIAKWNGKSWLKLGFGINASVRALAVMDTNLFVGGIFTQAGLMTVNRVAKWDGITWSALGSGMNNEVNALAVSGPDVYAGGAFTTAGTTVANRIAKWDGAAWSALGSGMDSAVRSLAVSGANLYAGGSFTNAGGIVANRVAKWDGITWSPLGSGTISTVHALALSGTNLYAGGSFTKAGNKVSAYVAKANIDAECGRFSNMAYYPATGFSCTFLDASVGQPYRIQSAPALAGPWTDFTNFVYTAPVVISDPAPLVGTNKFFRAVTP